MCSIPKLQSEDKNHDLPPRPEHFLPSHLQTHLQKYFMQIRWPSNGFQEDFCHLFFFFFFHLQLRIRKSQLGWLSHAADSFSTCHILQVQDWTFYYVQGYSLIWQTSHTLHKNVSETHLEIWLILTLAMLRNEILLGFPRYLWEALNIAHLKIYLKFCWEAGDEFTPGKVAFW